ncbi:MAG: glycosyltransferase [Calditrichaeota bacterium]|nr:MAG: glycosyltransferase [Calditrichota bacterium]
MWDVSSSNRVDYFLANSRHVATRIWKYYRREATVIHPPVDTELYRPGKKEGSYYLIVSAMVPYKRLDLAIETFNRLGKPLFVIGEGPEKKRLQDMAKANIRFLDWLPAEELVKYYSACKALVFPGEEDFGIVPVEAQSCGKPVIAYGKGGALETIIGYNGKNELKCSGVFFNSQTVEDMIAAIKKLETLSWDTGFIHQHSQKFSKKRFTREIKDFLEEKAREFFSTRG